MNFNDFIKQGKVKKGEKDKALVKSLLQTVHQDLKFLDSIEINDLSARKIMSNYYDVLRAVVEAIATLDGFKVYSHEAFTYYLKENKNEELHSLKFDRFRKIRNKLNYYGKNISVEEVLANILEIKQMINDLIGKYLEKNNNYINKNNQNIKKHS